VLDLTQHDPKSVVPFSHTSGLGLTVAHVGRPCVDGCPVLPIADEDAIVSIAHGLKSKVSWHLLGFGHHFHHGFAIAWRGQGTLRNEYAGILPRLELNAVVNNTHARKIVNPIFVS